MNVAHNLMATVTAPPQSATPSPVAASAPTVVRIEPPRGWLELRLAEVWEYRELLYFFAMRDIKIRYKQTAIGILWVVLQPLMTMGVFTIFFGRLAKLPSQGAPSSALDCLGGPHRAGSRAVDFGAERFVPRCARSNALCGAVLDAGLAGGL